MPVHLIKLAVDVESVEALRAIQSDRLEQSRRADETPALRHWTRHKPRRAAELIDGGSIYWVIKSHVRVRQRIVGIERGTDPEGRRRCALTLDADLVRTVPVPRGPHQGWRYLYPNDAPPDLDSAVRETGDLPPDMVAELRALGLL